MRCELVRAAITAVLLCAACGGDNSAANGGTESATTQTGQAMGQTGSSGSPATRASSNGASGAAGKAASTGTTSAGSAGAKAAATSAGAPSSAGSAGATATTPSTGMSAAAAGSGASTNAAAGAAGGAAAASGAAGAAGGASAMTDDCDRKCLMDVLQGYLDALVAHDATKVKVASSVKVTDNGVVAKLGDGLFKTGTMVLNDHRLDYADPVEGNVATQAVVNEGSVGVIYMVRLKVVKHEVTEIESMTVRQADAANGFFNLEAMKPEKVFLQEIPADKRMPRDKLKEITEEYLDYLEGKKNGMQVPFDEGCKRYENGQVTASGLASFNAQSWGFQVTHRILIIDEEAGITWGMFPFMQSDTALVVGEAFKIIDGKIMMIQAVMAYQPSKVWD